MSKKKKKSTRAEPIAIDTRSGVGSGQSAIWFSDSSGLDTLECSGYTRLSHNPEIITAVSVIARLVGAMSIHQMQNTENGDVRIVDGLSRVVDIAPNPLMTRANFIEWIVRNLYLEGNGNVVVLPKTRRGYLDRLNPVPPSYVSFVQKGYDDYTVMIAGKEYKPANVLHFVQNPSTLYPWKGEGYQLSLLDVANNLKQARATEKGFMASKWKPSIIVKVDSLTDEFASKEGRQKLLEAYAESGEAGEPWLIPADQFEVQAIKPLSLSDLALADFVKLDKQTVAAILGIPVFLLGIGQFNRMEWNSFITSTIMPLAQNIQQELTRKLLYSPDRYFKFSARSLYNYDIKELASVADEQYVRGIMTGNEVRGWLDLTPLDGLDELIILENYIPAGMIGDQKKLLQNGNNDRGDTE